MEIIIGVMAVAVGLVLGWILRQVKATANQNSAEMKAENLLKEAKAKQQETLVEAKEKAITIIDEAKKEEQERRQDLQKMQQRLEDRENKFDEKLLDLEQKKESWQKLLKIFWQEGWAFTRKIIVYVFLGIGVGAAIHGFVPAGFFEHYITAENLFAVPIATILAVPMYANAVGVIPIMQSLVEKGIPLGTAMAFMMAVVGLSLPEALILKRVMKMKLLVYFFGITTINIIIIGYLFNIFVK